MIRRTLAHVAPEELLLVPLVIVVIIAVLAQPTAITRLFETPYATPIPGDSPAEIFLERTPAPAPSPVGAPQRGAIFIGGSAGAVITSPDGRTRAVTPPSVTTFDRQGAWRQGAWIGQCPRDAVVREFAFRLQPDGPVHTLVACVDADGSVLTWDAETGTELRRVLVPGSISGP